MRRIRHSSCVVAIGIAVAFGASSATAQLPGVTCETAMVPMRDGVKLYTEIYKPQASGEYPVVVIRNPYGRLLGDGCFVGVFGSSVAAWAQQGYVGILQEVRGTMRSEGRYTPFFQEQNDGYDAIEWAATQPWSNGKVGTTSGSYLGVTQWQPAIKAPPHLLAISPAITASNYRDDWVGRNGVYDLAFNQNWGLLWVTDQIVRRLQEAGAPQSQIDQAVATWSAQESQNRSWFSALPLAGNWGDTLAGNTEFTIREMVPYLWEWYEHPTYDSYWATIDVSRHISDIVVPALVSGAWYDLFTVGTIENYRAMRTHAGSHAARAGTRLVMDCCGHSQATQSVPGQINWGPNRTDLTLTQRFLDHFVKGLDNGLDALPRVQLSVLVPPDSGTQGDTFILYANDYPVPGTTRQRYYLMSGGNANTRLGDGALRSSEPSEGPVDTFTYDPANPVPTTGGADASSFSGLAATDQSTVELRNDVLVYTSEPLTETLEVIGPITVRFWATTSAHDTDFTAKVVDIHPDGYAHNVIDRIVRARYREGSKSPPDFVTPGRPYEYEIYLGDTATELRVGHRVRLEISSSNFPHYARNLNTGLSNEHTSEIKVATQTILHDEAHPSYLDLPVVPLPAECIAQAHATKVAQCATLESENEDAN